MNRMRAVSLSKYLKKKLLVEGMMQTTSVYTTKYIISIRSLASRVQAVTMSVLRGYGKRRVEKVGNREI